MTRPRLHIAARRTLHAGFNHVEELTVSVTKPNGSSSDHLREIIDHGHAVAVLPIDPARRMVLLVRQWRAGLLESDDDPFLAEVCAGLIDEGETPEQAIRREAREELGVEIGNIEECGRIVVSPGCLTETIRLYRATYSDGSRISDGGGLDHEGEDIEVVEMSLDNLFEAARSGTILDAKTLVLVQDAMLRVCDESVDGR